MASSKSTAILIASLMDQSKSRLEVALEYINQNNDLMTDPAVTSKLVELRKTMSQLESVLAKVWADEPSYG